MAKTKNNKKPVATDTVDTVKEIGIWQTRLEAAKKNQKPVFETAAENYDIYYAKTSTARRASSPWKSNVFLPLLPGKARDIKAKLSILEPRFRVVPADAWEVNEETKEIEFQQDALLKAMKVSKKLNKEFVSYNAVGDLPPRANVDYCVTDATVAGWGLALAPLEVYTKVYHKYKPLLDEGGNPTAYNDFAQAVKTEMLRYGTKLEALDIFRVFGSPKMKSWERSPWIIIEREESYVDLEKANATVGEQVYNLPAGLKTAKGTAKTSDFSAVRNTALGFQKDGGDAIDESVDTFFVYDCYDQQKNKFYTFVEAKIEGAEKDWTLIREMDNPYNHGLIPIIPFYIKRRPGSPWGESIFEIAKEVQFAYNAAFNQFRDNAVLSTETMAVMDKNSMVDDYEIAPGNTIVYDSLNGEKPEPWKLADPNPAVFNAQMAVLEKSAEDGTVPQYTSGQVDSSMDKTAGTRGGIEMLVEMANDKLSEMYRNLKGSLLRYGYIALHNAQQYQNYIEVLDAPTMNAQGQAAIKAGSRVATDFLAPTELQEAFDLDIDDESMLPMTKSERRRTYLDFIRLLVELQGASLKQAEVYNTPEDIMRLDWDDISKEIGNQFGELNAPAFIKASLTQEDIAKKKVNDAKIEQQATEEAKTVAAEANPDAEIEQTPNGLQVQRQKRELINFKDIPTDSQNAVLESLGYPGSQLVNEQTKAQLAEAQATQIDLSVKQQMIEAAQNGQLDPATLAKFINK